jgi:hypothetical protein
MALGANRADVLRLVFRRSLPARGATGVDPVAAPRSE